MKIKVMFVCHGNICRSAMAEMIARSLVDKMGLSDKIEISSSGTSSEEEGNDIYPPAKRVLKEHCVPLLFHRAHRITDKEWDEADVVFSMDNYNLENLKRRFKDISKASLLLKNKEIEDPWYTGDFEGVYQSLIEGITSFLSIVSKSK